MAGIPSLFTAEALTSADAAYAQIVGATDAEVFLDGVADLKGELLSLDYMGKNTAVQAFIEALCAPHDYSNREPDSQKRYREFVGEIVRTYYYLFQQTATPSFAGTVRFATREAAVATLKKHVIARTTPASIQFLRSLGSEAGLNKAQQTILEKIFDPIPVKDLPEVFRLFVLEKYKNTLTLFSDAIAQGRISEETLCEAIRFRTKQNKNNPAFSVDRAVSILASAVAGDLKVSNVFLLEAKPQLKLEKLATTRDGRNVWKWEPRIDWATAADLNAFFVDTISIFEPNPVLVVRLLNIDALNGDHAQALKEMFFESHPEGTLIFYDGVKDTAHVVPRLTEARLEYSTEFLDVYPGFATPADVVRLDKEAQRERQAGVALSAPEIVLLKVVKRRRLDKISALAAEQIKKLREQRKLYLQARALFTDMPSLLNQLKKAVASEDIDKVYELVAIALLINGGYAVTRTHPHPLVRQMFFQLSAEAGEDWNSFWPEEQENIERDLQSKDPLVRRYAIVELATFGIGFGVINGLESARERLREVVATLKVQPEKEEEYQHALAVWDHVVEKTRSAQKAEVDQE